MDRKNVVSVGLTVLLASALIIGGAYAYQAYTNRNTAQEPGQVREDEVVIPADWKRLDSQQLGLSLRHPTDAQVSQTEQGITVYTWGPTQAEGTEVYDGMVINLRKAPLEGKTLKQAAEAQVEDWKVHGQITEPLREISFNGRTGYGFAASGLGDYNLYYLPAGDSFIEVSALIEDPKGQGFENTAKAILGSLEIR